MTRHQTGAARAHPPGPYECAERGAADRAATRRALTAVERDCHARLRAALAGRLGCDERLAGEALRFAYRQLLEQGDPAAATPAAAARIAFRHAARAAADQETREAGEEERDGVAEFLEFPPGQGEVLATATGPDGRRHKLRYLHPLVADCCELEPPRLVCELVAGEGRDQAEAATRAYADQLEQGTLHGPPARVGATRALGRRAGVVPA